jgi:hypothetical protein
MRPPGLSAISAAIFAIAAAAFAESPIATSATNSAPSAVDLSRIVAELIAEAIPREYERAEDWGQTKRITTGLRSSGNFFKFDIHRRKSEVRHGVWKKYRVTLLEPEKHLAVRIENLRHIEPGRTALTLTVVAKVHGWARAKVYERGIHLIALETEATTTVRLSIDAEISLRSIPSGSWLPGVAVRPVITDARLALDDFRMARISDLRGTLARELGDALRHVIEDEFTGPKLVAKLNRSIEKQSDRLQFSLEMPFGRQVEAIEPHNRDDQGGPDSVPHTDPNAKR